MQFVPHVGYFRVGEATNSSRNTEGGDEVQDVASSKNNNNTRRRGVATSAPQNRLVPLSELDLSGMLDVHPSDLIFTDKLGRGGSCNVFKGKYKDQEVAIKIYRDKGSKISEATARQFQHECKIMSQLNSESIIKFYGCCLKPRICIVVEYCARGSLYEIMRNEFIDINWSRFFKWCIQMTSAVASMHASNPPIFHRDIKSLNLLIDTDWNLKVCDFGLSRFADAESSLKKLRGTFHYCAPELYYQIGYSKKSDVYSLSIIFWELLYRCIMGKYMRPYSNNPLLIVEYSIIIKTAKEHLRPDFPPRVPFRLEKLIRRCWGPDPAARPLCTQIVNKLRKIEKLYQENKEEWDAIRDTSNLQPTKTMDCLSEVSSLPPKQPLSVKDLQFLEAFFHLEDENIDVTDHIERGRSVSLPDNSYKALDSEQTKNEEEKGKEKAENDEENENEKEKEEKPKRRPMGKDERARVLLKMSSMPIGLIMPKKPAPARKRPKSDDLKEEVERVIGEREKKEAEEEAKRKEEEEQKAKQEKAVKFQIPLDKIADSNNKNNNNSGQQQNEEENKKEKEKEKEKEAETSEGTTSSSEEGASPTDTPKDSADKLRRRFQAFMGEEPLSPHPERARKNNGDDEGDKDVSGWW